MFTLSCTQIIFVKILSTEMNANSNNSRAKTLNKRQSKVKRFPLTRILLHQKVRRGLTKWWHPMNEHRRLCLKAKSTEFKRLFTQQRRRSYYKWKNRRQTTKRQPWAVQFAKSREEVSDDEGEESDVDEVKSGSLMSLVEARQCTGYYFKCLQPKIGASANFTKLDDQNEYQHVKIFAERKKTVRKKKATFKSAKLAPTPKEPLAVFDSNTYRTICEEKSHVRRYYDRHAACYGHKKLSRTYIRTRAPKLNGRSLPRQYMHCTCCGFSVSTAERFGFEDKWPTLDRPHICTCELSLFSKYKTLTSTHKDVPLFNILDRTPSDLAKAMKKLNEEAGTETKACLGTIPHYINFSKRAPLYDRATNKKIYEGEVGDVGGHVYYKQLPKEETSSKFSRGKRESTWPMETMHIFAFDDAQDEHKVGAKRKFPQIEEPAPPTKRCTHVRYAGSTSLTDPKAIERMKRWQTLKKVRGIMGTGKNGSMSLDTDSTPLTSSQVPSGIPLEAKKSEADMTRIPSAMLLSPLTKSPEQATSAISHDSEYSPTGSGLMLVKPKEFWQSIEHFIKKQDKAKAFEYLTQKLQQKQKAQQAEETLEPKQKPQYAEKTAEPKQQRGLSLNIKSLQNRLKTDEQMKKDDKIPPMPVQRPSAREVAAELRSNAANLAIFGKPIETDSTFTLGLVAKEEFRPQHIARVEEHQRGGLGIQVEGLTKAIPDQQMARRTADGQKLKHATIDVLSEKDREHAALVISRVAEGRARTIEMPAISFGEDDLAFYEVWESFTHSVGAKKGSFQLHVPTSKQEIEKKVHFMKAWKEYTHAADLLRASIISVSDEQLATDPDVVENTIEFFSKFQAFVHNAWEPDDLPHKEMDVQQVLNHLDPTKANTFLKEWKKWARSASTADFKGKIEQNRLHRSVIIPADLQDKRSEQQMFIEEAWLNFLSHVDPEPQDIPMKEIIGEKLDPVKQLDFFNAFRSFMNLDETLHETSTTEEELMNQEFSTWLAFMQGITGDGSLPVGDELLKYPELQKHVIDGVIASHALHQENARQKVITTQPKQRDSRLMKQTSRIHRLSVAAEKETNKLLRTNKFIHNLLNIGGGKETQGMIMKSLYQAATGNKEAVKHLLNKVQDEDKLRMLEMLLKDSAGGYDAMQELMGKEKAAGFKLLRLLVKENGEQSTQIQKAFVEEGGKCGLELLHLLVDEEDEYEAKLMENLIIQDVSDASLEVMKHLVKYEGEQGLDIVKTLAQGKNHNGLKMLRTLIQETSHAGTAGRGGIDDSVLNNMLAKLRSEKSLKMQVLLGVGMGDEGKQQSAVRTEKEEATKTESILKKEEEDRAKAHKKHENILSTEDETGGNLQILLKAVINTDQEKKLKAQKEEEEFVSEIQHMMSMLMPKSVDRDRHLQTEQDPQDIVDMLHTILATHKDTKDDVATTDTDDAGIQHMMSMLMPKSRNRDEHLQTEEDPQNIVDMLHAILVRHKDTKDDVATTDTDDAELLELVTQIQRDSSHEDRNAHVEDAGKLMKLLMERTPILKDSGKNTRTSVRTPANTFDDPPLVDVHDFMKRVLPKEYSHDEDEEEEEHWRMDTGAPLVKWFMSNPKTAMVLKDAEQALEKQMNKYFRKQQPEKVKHTKLKTQIHDPLLKQDTGVRAEYKKGVFTVALSKEALKDAKSAKRIRSFTKKIKKNAAVVSHWKAVAEGEYDTEKVTSKFEGKPRRRKKGYITAQAEGEQVVEQETKPPPEKVPKPRRQPVLLQSIFPLLPGIPTHEPETSENVQNADIELIRERRRQQRFHEIERREKVRNLLNPIQRGNKLSSESKAIWDDFIYKRRLRDEDSNFDFEEDKQEEETDSHHDHYLSNDASNIVYRPVPSRMGTVKSTKGRKTAIKHMISTHDLLNVPLSAHLMPALKISHISNWMFETPKQSELETFTANTIPKTIKARTTPITIPDYTLAISLRSSTFSLPQDLEQLESMTPIDYLKHHVTPDPARKFILSRVFYSHKKYDKLSLGKCRHAILSILHTYITNEDLDKLYELVGIKHGVEIRFRLFSGLCALAERMVFPKFAAKVKDEKLRAKYDKTDIEVCDFRSFQKRSEHITIPDKLKDVLKIVIAPGWSDVESASPLEVTPACYTQRFKRKSPTSR